MATLREIQARRRAEKDKKPTLADLRARKQKQKEESAHGLAALRRRKRMQKSSKNDFMVSGVRYHNPQQVNGYWTVDVTNGDKTFTLHNRFGSWMHSMGDMMREPAAVARMLGTNMSQLEMAMNLIARMEMEQKALGIPTRAQLLRMREEQAIAARRKKREKSDDTKA